jgi:hypothetical protein
MPTQCEVSQKSNQPPAFHLLAMQYGLLNNLGLGCRWGKPATRLDLDRFIMYLRAPSGSARNENPPGRQSDEPRQESEINRRQRY